jgi:hypothetical protein
MLRQELDPTIGCFLVPLNDIVRKSEYINNHHAGYTCQVTSWTSGRSIWWYLSIVQNITLNINFFSNIEEELSCYFCHEERIEAGGGGATIVWLLHCYIAECERGHECYSDKIFACGRSAFPAECGHERANAARGGQNGLRSLQIYTSLSCFSHPFPRLGAREPLEPASEMIRWCMHVS